ncbi:MAG TPA: TIR domain-containing protein, partial [Pyrinomonadaceae bacterium]|nr:TIR domain-containing protein [Pyrinomonadaceae bacterium]
MRLLFPLTGDDVFISYSRKDGALYAAGLADKLTEKNLSCFIDKLGTEPNHDLPPSLRKKIKNCTVFVLIGTEKAAESEFVKKEITEFKQTGRTILPVDFDGNVGKAVWYEDIPGLAPEPERDLTALETGEPSQNVVSFIEKSFNYTRRNQRMFRMFWGALSIFLLLVALSLGGFFVARNQIVKAAVATARAEEETRRANEATDLANREAADALQKTEEARIAGEEAKKSKQEAETANEEAKKQTELANEKTKLADSATKKADAAEKLADEKTELARQQTVLAEEKTKLANTEAKRANKQQSIADATLLSNETIDLLNKNNPAVLEQGFKNAITANQKVDTNSLALIQPISTLRRVLSFTPKMMPETFFSVLETNSSCDNFAFSTNQLSFACQKGNKVKVYQVLNPQESEEFDFNDHLVIKDINNIAENNELSQCLYNTNERKVSKVNYLSVSDDGKRVALSVADEYKNEDGDREDIYDSYRILVKDSNRKTHCQKTGNIEFSSLSPDGKTLIYSDVESSQADTDLDFNFLRLWRIEDDSEILECGYSRNIKYRQNGNFSPDGKRLITINQDLDKKSTTKIHEFLLDRKKQPAKCTQTPLVDMDSNNPSEYFLRSYNIDIGFGEIKSIAVNNSGSKIALESNGISIWEVTSDPRLEILIPPQFSSYISLMFTQVPSPARENIKTFIKDETRFINQTWLITGYREEDCEICKQMRDPSEVSGFSDKHPELKAEINGTKLTILRKSDLAVIDYINF